MQSAGHSTEEVLNQLMNTTHEILQKVNLILSTGVCIPPVPTSCQEIKDKQPHSASGMYKLAFPYNKTQYVYCHMGELCGIDGGWTRLGYLDATDPRQTCPTGFKWKSSNGVRACGRATGTGGSCQSVQFPSNGVSYSQVCGKVVGYQYGSPDAVYNGGDPNHNNINSYYVDGVSITHGFPRQHIWTLMSGVSDSNIHANSNCPCSTGSTQRVQSFIGNDYFCESGNPNRGWEQKLYEQDPLWDAKGCGTNEATCCSANRLPWFYKVLNTVTTNYIELRVCGDQVTSNEDVPVSFYAIYVK